MPEPKLTLQNYRAFPNDAPIEIAIADGITFFLGVNNVGKSALLRTFYELRPVINTPELRAARSELVRSFQLNLPGTYDRIIHRQQSDRPIRLAIEQDGAGFEIEV